MNHKDCLICDRIIQIKENRNPYFVKELKTGYVVLEDYQFFKGYSLFLCKEHVSELHELNPDFKKQFLNEMSIVAEAVYKVLKPQKLNYELLGNTEPHLHWHIIPRYEDDPLPNRPIWNIDKSIRNNDKTKPNLKELDRLKKMILKKL